MRMIFSTPHVPLIEEIASQLNQEKIEFSIESKQEKEWDNDDYGLTAFSVWINDDDNIDRAKEIVQKAQHKTPFYTAPKIKPVPLNLNFLQKKFKISRSKKRPQPSATWTLFFLLLCIAFFTADAYQRKGSLSNQIEHATPTTFSPMRQAFFIDYPQAVASQDASLERNINQPPTASYWEGIYTLLLMKISGIPADPPPSSNPDHFLERVRQGEIWRLVTPCLLHGDFIHLLFNMLWLIYLGSQIEIRISTFRYILLTVIFAITSNLAQYAVTGPFFLGFSGIVCGLIGFVRSRQRRAPWEGYNLTSATFTFISLFIWTLAALSTLAFFISWYFKTPFGLPLANTAHITGLISGFLFGRLSFFATQEQLFYN